MRNHVLVHAELEASGEAHVPLFVLLLDLDRALEQALQAVDHLGLGPGADDGGEVPVHGAGFIGELGVRVEEVAQVGRRGAGGAGRVEHGLVEEQAVAVDLVGDDGHRGLDEPLGEVVDVEEQVLAGEGDVHAELCGEGDGNAGFSRVLDRDRGAGPADVTRGLPHVHGVADLGALDGELVVIFPVHVFGEREGVFQHHGRFAGDGGDGKKNGRHLRLL